jgi:hypothetical protein
MSEYRGSVDKLPATGGDAPDDENRPFVTFVDSTAQPERSSGEFRTRGGERSAEYLRVDDLVTLNRLLLAVAVGLSALVLVRWRNYQWDFYMFYGSAADFVRGASPYRGHGLSFYHLPLTLYLYALFARLPFPIAYELWYGLKLAALAGLLYLWRRQFLKFSLGWSTTLYFMLGYNAAIYSDLVSGNISIFEQLGLWLGFFALVRGRYAAFCLCVILVAQFKLTPILFAALLLVVPPRPQWAWFTACCAGFLAVFSLNYALQPALLNDFWRVAPLLDERGTTSPSMLAFIRDIVDGVAGPHASDRSHADEALFAFTSLAGAAASLAALARYRRDARQVDAKVIVYFACLVFALVVPRMRVYSHVLLLIPSLHLLHVLPRRPTVSTAVALVALLVACPYATTLLPTRAVVALSYEYLPLIAAAAAVWFGFLRLLRGDWAPESTDAGATA